MFTSQSEQTWIVGFYSFDFLEEMPFLNMLCLLPFVSGICQPLGMKRLKRNFVKNVKDKLMVPIVKYNRNIRYIGLSGGDDYKTSCMFRTIESGGFPQVCAFSSFEDGLDYLPKDNIFSSVCCAENTALGCEVGLPGFMW